MSKLFCILIFAGLTACSSGSDGTGAAPVAGTDACSIDGQKQYVLDRLYEWYLWNAELPANINIADYTSPEDLVSRVTLELGPKDASGDPIDRFSSVGSAAADSQFFGEGKFEGYGFGFRFEAVDDMRITRTFADSPAAAGGLERGQQVLSLNGRSIADINANEGISAFFSQNPTVDFEIQPLAGAVFFTFIAEDIVTIDPVPQWNIIDAGNGRMVGYFEFSQFISTANPDFVEIFSAFSAAGVNDLIIDLRYNGGGLVSTAELLGDYLGYSIAPGLLFSSTEFNADRAAQNNYQEFFEFIDASISLSSLVVIASRGTASASELVTNGMIPHVNVAIVGDDTFGKPVGQIGLEFCDKILRPTAFELANADGTADYFDGLPVTPGCEAPDDLSVAVGHPQDPNMIAALGYLNTGSCPAPVLMAPEAKGAYAVGVAEPARQKRRHRDLFDAF